MSGYCCLAIKVHTSLSSYCFPGKISKDLCQVVVVQVSFSKHHCQVTVLLVSNQQIIGIFIMLCMFRDGILRERCEQARGTKLADCGRICGSPHKSVGSIEEMWQNYSK